MTSTTSTKGSNEEMIEMQCKEGHNRINGRTGRKGVNGTKSGWRSQWSDPKLAIRSGLIPLHDPNTGRSRSPHPGLGYFL